MKSSHCNYSDAYILVTGDITEDAGNDTDVALKNFAPFLHARQKFMKILLMKKSIFTL